MAFDFNTLTEKDEQAAKAKFREHGRGVNMGSFEEINQRNASKWEDLIDPSKFSLVDIRNKMLGFARSINTNCNDALLGELDVAFVHRTELDEVVPFTFIELYSFLRAVYRHRINTDEYKAKKKAYEELNQFVATNKSRSEKLKEAKQQLKNLSKELNFK
jgi:hypothetical protein